MARRTKLKKSDSAGSISTVKSDATVVDDAQITRFDFDALPDEVSTLLVRELRVICKQLDLDSKGNVLF